MRRPAAPAAHGPQAGAAGWRRRVLRTTRRDGTLHLTPLIADQDTSGNFLVMATNFGRRHHSAWSCHLLRDLRAVIDWRCTSIPVHAQLLTRRQQDEVRDRILEVMPVFDDYVRPSHREVCVFSLTPPPTQVTSNGAAGSPGESRTRGQE